MCTSPSSSRASHSAAVTSDQLTRSVARAAPSSERPLAGALAGSAPMPSTLRTHTCETSSTDGPL